MRAADGRAVTSIDPVVARPRASPRAGGAGGGDDDAPSTIAIVSGDIPNAGVGGRLEVEPGFGASPLEEVEPVAETEIDEAEGVEAGDELA